MDEKSTVTVGARIPITELQAMHKDTLDQLLAVRVSLTVARMQLQEKDKIIEGLEKRVSELENPELEI